MNNPLIIDKMVAQFIKNPENSDELIKPFLEGDLPPAEDEAWYNILSMGSEDPKLLAVEQEVLSILNKRGINAYIDGEKDSFGWVTRGIFIDGECMCIY